MKKIFINGLSAKAGGGKSILTNYLKLLSMFDNNNKYFILAPYKNVYQEFKSQKIEIINLPSFFSSKLLFPIVYLFVIPIYLNIKKVDLVFNLADIPIRTKIKQVFLFDWPYAVYLKSEVWKKLSWLDYLIKISKLYLFKKYSKYIDVLIAQTDTMQILLNSLYQIRNIKVVPNAVSLDNLTGGLSKDYNFPSGFKFLYLTHYYPHKNVEIFLDIAKLIKVQNLEFKLITTLDPNQHKGAKYFLDDIKKFELEDIIINVGPVKMEHVPSLYLQCDALLIPTLLESFSGTYVEAMYHKKPILTSNYDFALDVCKDAAIYFDPNNANEILYAMKSVSTSKTMSDNLVFNGSKVLSQMATWNEAFTMYNKIIKDLF